MLNPDDAQHPSTDAMMATHGFDSGCVGLRSRILRSGGSRIVGFLGVVSGICWAVVCVCVCVF